jgi:hypothetical protein
MVGLVDSVTATLAGTLIGGLIGVIGSLITLFVPRYLRTRGGITVQTSRWELKPSEDNPADYTCKLSIYMDNHMEITTAAQDIRLVLKRGENASLVCTPKEVYGHQRLDVLILPSHVPVNRDVKGKIDAKLLQEHFGDPFEETSVNQVQLTGSWSTGKALEHNVIPEGAANKSSSSSHSAWLGPWYSRLL